MTRNTEHLPVLAAVAFTGAEAAHFLQGQLTIDSEALPAGRWRRAAYCSRQGRIIACGLLARLPDEAAQQRFFFIMRSDIAESVAMLLKKFVLRAKVAVAVPPLFMAVCGGALIVPAASDGTVEIDDEGVAHLDEGEGRMLCFNTTEAALQRLQAGSMEYSGAWEKTEIQRAVAWVGAAAQELFIPQFLNFELLGGVDFEKGCYVGQEVISRLHHLGEVKQRGMIITAAAAAEGDAIKTADGKPAGAAVNIAATDTGFIGFAAVAKRASGEELFIEGNPIALQSPPYEIREQEKFKRR